MSIKHFFYVLVLSVLAAGCAADLSLDNNVIAVVGNHKITYGDFQRQLAQNYVPQTDSMMSLDAKSKFLDLLIDYNLKLQDAKKERLMDDPAIRDEMKNYETQLAVSYITEHELVDPMIKTIYERQKYEVRAKYIFVRFPIDSLHPHGDTLKAYDESVAAIKDLKAGAPIDSLMHLYSGEDTYYITAGTFLQYVGGEEFENMLYTLKPGEVGSTPIRTSFGYLVVKLEERRPRVESARASHILIAIKGNTPKDTLEAYDRALAILDSVKQGVSFAKLAEDNSADKASAKRGGDLGYFKRGEMVRPFDQAVFNMKVGQVVGPVRTQFGYHIIKLTDLTPVPPFSTEKDQLRQYYVNSVYKTDLANFVDVLKQKYDFKMNGQIFDFLYGKVDSTKRLVQSNLDSLLTPAERRESLFTFDKSSGTIDTVFALARDDRNLEPLYLNWQGLHYILDEAAKKMVFAHYADEKAPTYPDFDSLMTKYENGILIYNIERDKVWNKIQATDSLLKPYYFAHIDRYYWPERVDISEIHVSTDSAANTIYDMLKNGDSFDTLAAKYNQSPALAEKDGHAGLFADSSNALAIQAFRMKEGEFSKPIVYAYGFSIIRVNKFVPSEPKTFDEARGEVSSDYQDVESKRIQSEWLEKLRKEFGVKIYENKFHALLAGE
ncbi:MAG: peptidylprolyl isomerase [Bacteroidetes bacterium]|nr:peptidylprolyl isomerase [Bacteroidota bacterium]